jgi:hypothetical protein
MGYAIKQSSTAQPLLFFMQDSAASRFLGKTGLTCTVTLSKNGGSFASPAGAVSEVGNGWYAVAGNATDSGTLGPLTLYATASGADPCTVEFTVVAYDPQSATSLGLSDIIAIKAKTDNLPSDPADASDIAASFSTVNSALSTISGYLDTEVAAILAAVDTEVAAIKAKTDNLPADPADASDIASSFSTVSSSLSSLASTLSTISGYLDTEVAAILAAVDTEVAAIKAKTDNLPSDPADASDIAASFSTVNSTLSTISTNTQDLPVMITGDGTAGAKFTTTALSNAPGGGGGSSAPVLYTSPLSVVVEAGASDEQFLTLRRSHIGPLRVNLVDASKVPIATTGATLTAAIYSPAGTELLTGLEVTELLGDEGQVSVQADMTEAALADYATVNLTVTRDNGATDVTTATLAIRILG